MATTFQVYWSKFTTTTVKGTVLKSTIISLSHKETPTNTFTQAEINIRNMYDSANIGNVQLGDVKEQLSN